ncbi:MAG: M3 family metallopeptidase [Candidatus Nitrosopolaris sp.]
MFKPKIGSWGLDDLIKDPNGNEFQEFLQSIVTKVTQLESRRKDLHDNVKTLEFENFLHSIKEISEKISIASGYAHLCYAADTSSNERAALVTKMGMFGCNIANRLLFFDLRFKKEIGEENAQRLIESVSPVYREYLNHLRLLAKYTLTEPEEKIITTLEVTGTSAIIKIYDRTTSGFEFVMTLKGDRRTIKKTFINKERGERSGLAYFTLFEIDAHRAVAEQNATIDAVSELYLNNLKEQFGNSVNVSHDFQWEWLYIPHLHHTPFYCYAYSFGNLLVVSLYQQLKSEGKKSFIPKYINILSAGGSRKPEDLLKESGIDISKMATRI